MAKKKNGYHKEGGKWVYYANGKVLKGKDIIRYRTTGQTEKNILQGGFIDPLTKNLSNAAKDILLIGRGSDKTSGGKPISALQEKYATQRGIKIDPRRDPRLQQQFLNNDERVPQSGLATDLLDGLSAKVDFSNTNKLNINPYFRQENIQRFTDAGYQAPGTALPEGTEFPYKGKHALTIANVNDKAPIEKAVNTDYEDEHPLSDPDYNPESTRANQKKLQISNNSERVKAIERVYGAQLMHKKTKEARNAFIQKKLNKAPTVLELEAM